MALAATVVMTALAGLGGGATAAAQRSAGAGRTPDGAGAGMAESIRGRSNRGTGGVARTYCRFFHVGEATQEAPQGTIGAEELEHRKLPIGTPLWRACYLRAGNRLVEGPALWFTGTNPLDRLQLARLTVDLPELETSPPNATLPNIATFLWADNETDQAITVSMGGDSITVRSSLLSIRFRIVPSADPALASVDDGRVIDCPGPAVAFNAAVPAAAQTSRCQHRFAGPARTLAIETTTLWRLWWQQSDGSTGELDPLERTQVASLRIGRATTRIAPVGWSSHFGSGR
ncbi:MAG: hypothetical protein GX868_10245 [Actinobacteria bacterium]|nr:hypothetical protein [Actinomycetota bacterium]